MRDAAKMLARNKQEMIANELSRLACDEYLEDIMQHMRHMEVRDPPRSIFTHHDTMTRFFLSPWSSSSPFLDILPSHAPLNPMYSTNTF